MPLPMPQKSTAPYLYKYSGPANLGWLKDILHQHEIYLPNLTQLNDDNDGLPHLAMQSEQEMADFLWSSFKRANPSMSPQDLQHEEKVLRFNVHLHGPAALHPNLVKLLDGHLKHFRVYSMTKRYDMGNLWALYADGHKGYCLEFQNVGPLFEHAMDVSYLPSKDMVVPITDPDVLSGRFVFCKTREWQCEEEVRLMLPPHDGRIKVSFNPVWLTRIILGKAISDENRNTIRLWVKERKPPELAVATTYYDPTQRAIRLREEEPQNSAPIRGKRLVTNQFGSLFGNPEFAKDVRSAFPKVFEVLPRVAGALSDLTGRAHPNPKPNQRIIVNLGLLVGISMFELVTLAENGFGQGAMKIARTVMETAINAEYLRQFPSDVDNYVDWYLVEKYKEFSYVKEHIPHLLPSIDPEAIASIEKGFEEVKASFRKPNGDLRSSWCGLNLADRAAKTGFADAYKLISPLSSVFIHATVGGLARHFDTGKDEDRISIPPSLKYCKEALSGGHMCMCRMVETVVKTFDWTPVHSIESLAQDFSYAWASEEQKTK